MNKQYYAPLNLKQNIFSKQLNTNIIMKEEATYPQIPAIVYLVKEFI